jgi:hypothetical protein
MSGLLEMFKKIVYENWYPKCWTDKKYKTYESVQFITDALLALAED